MAPLISHAIQVQSETIVLYIIILYKTNSYYHIKLNVVEFVNTTLRLHSVRPWTNRSASEFDSIMRECIAATYINYTHGLEYMSPDKWTDEEFHEFSAFPWLYVPVKKIY